MNILVIEVLANSMRKAIELTPREKLPLAMSHFPKGACGDASLLLGTYMFENGLAGFEHVSGERGNSVNHSWVSHAWLSCGRWIVDITADQFNDALSAVIVSDSSEWHEQFHINNRSPSDFRLYPYGEHELRVFYEYLKPQLFK